MMSRGILTIFTFIFLSATSVFAGNGGNANLDDPYIISFEPNFTDGDTLPPIEDREGDFFTNDNYNPFDLDDPPAIEQEVTYDPETGYYIVREKVGEQDFRPPTYLTLAEYLEWSSKQERNDYFKQLSNDASIGGGGKDPIDRYKANIKSSLIDRLFGGTTVDIRPNGNIDLTFGADFQEVENPILTEQQRRNGGFNFDMAIQMNVIGKIGEKLKLSTNYNTQATFDFENQMKLEYTGFEDEIIQKIEAGNVSLPLKSSLIQGSQSLFGLKTELRFGRLNVTSVVSQKKSKREQVAIEGGTQVQEFEVTADQYDENRHFFLSHYNRSVYEGALQDMPNINSQFKITKLEVWITNDRNETENVRNIVALSDLGEPVKVNPASSFFLFNPLPNPPVCQDNINPECLAVPEIRGLPCNDANRLFDKLINSEGTRSLDNSVATLTSSQFGLNQAEDFEKVGARLLSPSEYTVHNELGYVSVNASLQQDAILGVSFEYTHNGNVYRVGEFASDLPPGADSSRVFFVKMLKSTTPRVDLPIWDLMMKNVYSIGAFQVNSQDFELDVLYQDPEDGAEKRFLPTGSFAFEPLISVLNLDNLNSYNDPIPDGNFDFVAGITINPRNGRIIFPVLEPFGGSLEGNFDDPYSQLYDSTITRAREYAELNRFVMRGSYKSSVSSEISLGAFNIPEGSVTVTAGGAELREGIDYTIDYNIGRIKILNEAYLNNGIPVNVSYEDNTLFGFQTKTMFGTRLDYALSKDINIGGTYMHVSERPFTQKVNIGDDPISNSVYGLDFQYSKEAPLITRLVDKIPLIQTKEPSQISFTAEGAWMRPGHSKALNKVDGDQDKGGTVYLDDFEGSVSNFDLRTPATAWVLSSIPQTDDARFPEAELINNIESGMNRAKIAWYRIDPILRRGNDAPGAGIYTNQVSEQDIFPNSTPQNGIQNAGIFTFDLKYNPDVRGPYNFDAAGSDNSAGIDSDGNLNDPQSRWGGIQRSIQTNDFEEANIEFIEVWMLSPFHDGRGGTGGELNLNLGSVSEDILRDSRRFYEHGLPRDGSTSNPTDQTNWSRIPRTITNTNAFDNDPDTRASQDVGLDGLNNEGEQIQFAEYLTNIQPLLAGGTANPHYQQAAVDPAGDDYLYHSDDSWNIGTSLLDRYEFFNNPQGNSQGENNSYTNIPDQEDINKDNTLSETEAYYEYTIPLFPNTTPGALPGEIQDHRFIKDTVRVGNGNGGQSIWYQFQIPIDEFNKAHGGIQDFRSIRFMRMYMNGFDEEVILRFARLQLVRNQWRRFLRNLDGGQQTPGVDFSMTSVNFEQNNSKFPFPYVLPPGVQRENSLGTVTNALQNEQSLAIDICDLPDAEDRGIYKILNLDMRRYERLKMYVHAESEDNLNVGEMSIFIRMGSDFTQNYYEYEIPLTMSETILSSDSEADIIEKVWPEANTFNFPLEVLRQLKLQRNAQTPPWPLPDEFVTQDPEQPMNNIRIKGNPDLGLVKGIMIGVRNIEDMGPSLCTEVWVNELRASGLDERGGVAGLARMDIKLADWGNFTASTNYTGIGWGQIEQKVNQRSLEEVVQYDVATNLEMGKFLPKNSGVRIPLYVQYSKTVKNPEFDPLQKDIKLKESLRAADPSVRPEIKKAAQDLTAIKSINLTNVRKERTNTKRKPMPYDIENFSATYAWSNSHKRDPIIESDNVVTHRGSLDYNYSRQVKYIEPFKKLIKSKSKWFGLVKDLNFNPLPNSFTFRNDMNRHVGQIKYRFSNAANSTFFDKRFLWDRTYGAQWNLTKSINVSFNATNNATVDELEGSTDNNPNGDAKEYLRNNLWGKGQNPNGSEKKFGGRTKNYNQSISASYTLPTKLIPLLDWTNIRAQYSANYSWSAAARNFEYKNVEIKAEQYQANIIQNGQNRQINTDLDFTKLYNKSKYLKKINTKPKPSNGKDSKTKSGASGKSGVKTGKPGSELENPKAGGKNQPGIEKPMAPKSKDELVGGQKPTPGGKGAGTGDAASAKEAAKAKAAIAKAEKKAKREKRQPTMVERIILRPLMIVRKARFSYSEQFNSTVPGWMPETNYFGRDNQFGAPGWGYTLGLTRPDKTWLDDGAKNGQFTRSLLLNQQVTDNRSLNLDAKLTLEPFKDFRIELTGTRSYSENHSEYFKVFEADPAGGLAPFEHKNGFDAGSINLTFYTLNTMFEQLDQDNISATFQQFEANREIISQRLGELNPRSQGLHITDFEYGDYSEGYGRYQQDVLIPAFLAAYTKKDASTYPLKVKNIVPRPNWRVSYNGLSKMKGLKNVFASFNVSHGYSSTLTMSSFSTDLRFDDQYRVINDNTGSYFSEYRVPDLAISEQFSPLIGIDMKFKNDLTAKFDWKKSRILGMNLIDFQLVETKTEEFTIGLGYRVKGLKLPFNITLGKKKAEKLENDLNFKFDMSFRDDKTVNHLLDQNTSLPTRGLKTITWSPSIDYAVNKKLNVRLFFDRRRTIPATSASYAMTNTSGGVMISFQLSQ